MHNTQLPQEKPHPIGLPNQQLAPNPLGPTNKCTNSNYLITKVGQSIIKYRLENGVPHGKALEESPNGKIRFTYVQGIRKGPAKIELKEGTIKIVNYNDIGILEGPATIVTKAHTIVCKYQFNQPHGSATQIDHDGNRYEFTYAKGIRQGPVTMYLANGSICKGTYLDNKIQGILERIDPDNTKSAFTIQDSQLEGPAMVVKFKCVKNLVQENATVTQSNGTAANLKFNQIVAYSSSQKQKTTTTTNQNVNSNLDDYDLLNWDCDLT